MKDEVLVKLALLRYALIPQQLIAFDEAHGKDSYEFNKYFQVHKEKSKSDILDFLNRIEAGHANLDYMTKCESIWSFSASLPFLDISSFVDLISYNPFDDFDSAEVDAYFSGKHIPEKLDVDDDEASIFYAGDVESFYQWYNDLNDKSLMGLLRLYLNFLQEK